MIQNADSDDSDQGGTERSTANRATGHVGCKHSGVELVVKLQEEEGTTATVPTTATQNRLDGRKGHNS